MILGAAKSGTTSLHQFLLPHPEISMGSLKEIHYFDWNYEKPEEWYEGHFSTQRKYRLEATPYYIFHPLLPARVHAYNPNCKFIIILRDPAERAISHYFHNLKVNRTKDSFPEHIKKFIPHNEDLSITAAFQSEEERINNQYELVELNAKNKSYNNSVLQHFSYKARGNYAEQLRRWYAFFPKNQFLLIDFDDLVDDPESCLISIFKFLGIGKVLPTQYGITNQGSYIKSPEILELEKKLRDYFKPFDRDLVELTNKKFRWMKD